MSDLISYDDWTLVPQTEWGWSNFTPNEMRCRGTGKLTVSISFMARLQELRNRLGFALPVTSGYRSPEYNAKISTTGLTGPHTTGRAVDIAIYGERAYLLMVWAPEIGFEGIGWKQHGPHSQRFIHLDDLAAPDFPRPNIWSYK